MKYVLLSVLVSVLAACCADWLPAQERDTVAVLVAEYGEDIRALMDRAVEVGMLDEAGRDSVLRAAGLPVADTSEVGETGEAETQLTRLSLLTEMRQEWYTRLQCEYLRQDALTELVGAPVRMSASAFHPRYLPLAVIEDNLKWAASRPLEVSEILARDRKLILTRMINDSAMPQFLRDLRGQNPAVYSVVAILMGIFGGAGNGFLSGSTMDMLVPRPVVGGQPSFDDMIFLDPNFDPMVYSPSRPLPQYVPENPSQPYKAVLRRNGGQVRSDGPPPVQESRYVIK